MIAKICLMFVRFALACWVGAAVLFVITSVLEARTGSFHITSPVLDVLVTTRFPPYYIMGWSCLGVTLCCGLLTMLPSTFYRKRLLCIVTLAAIALVTMVVDYHCIYTPLAEMVTPPGKARDMQFDEFHNLSKNINTFSLSLCLLAAFLACYPFQEKTSTENVVQENLTSLNSDVTR